MTALERVQKQYPEVIGKTKKERIIDYIQHHAGILPEGAKVINASAHDRWRWVSSNIQTGMLEDCSIEYMMQIARSLGYKCYQSGIIEGSILLRKKGSNVNKEKT